MEAPEGGKGGACGFARYLSTLPVEGCGVRGVRGVRGTQRCTSKVYSEVAGELQGAAGRCKPAIALQKPLQRSCNSSANALARQAVSAATGGGRQLRNLDSGLMQLARDWTRSTHEGRLGAVVPDQWSARGKGLPESSSSAAHSEAQKLWGSSDSLNV